MVMMEFFGEIFSVEEKKEKFGDKNYYELKFLNKGGLVMFVILEWIFEDGMIEIECIFVEIWCKNENNFIKVFVKEKEVIGICLDFFKEIVDIDESNNNWLDILMLSCFKVFKQYKFEKLFNLM